MRLLILLLVTTAGSLVGARFVYEQLVVPFATANGGSTTEQVFIEYYSHSALYDKNMAINMTVISDEPVAFSADKCGKRLFETATDIQNASYIWNKEWVETMLTGIGKICNITTEYAIDFTMVCQGPCNGTIYFDVIPVPEEDFEGRTNSREGVIPFKTVGGDVPTIITSDIGFVIDAVFLNARLRIELAVEYTTDYTLAIGKCGMEMLAIKGNGTKLNHTITWEEIKLLRMVKSTQCAQDRKDTIDYMMKSEKPGNGTVSFLMTRAHENLEHHPQNEYMSMELAMGVPKLHPKVPKKYKAANSVNYYVAWLIIIIDRLHLL